MIGRVQELPYFEDSAALFLPWAGRPWSVFLDSGFPHSRQGRYDILAADPVKTLVTRGDLTEIRTGSQVVLSGEDPFSLLQEALGPVMAPLEHLPFCGGALGYFGYDLARRLERLPSKARDAENIPDMMIGIYEWAVIVDHHERKTFLVSRTQDFAASLNWPHLVRRFSQLQTLGWQLGDFKIEGMPKANLDEAAYGRAFRQIQHYIGEGDCYQVNLAMRFEACSEGDPWEAYQYLRTFNPAPYGAYLNYPDVQILSSSPERFLKVSDHCVETKPIKGTRPRGTDSVTDATAILALRDSLKDRAENLMIVDLLRNDIGKSCLPGSVHVPKLFDIESYANVHHMVSTVRGRLGSNADGVALLKGCFPGGSITGAPKIRAMEIIEELEPHRRGLYCGSIGYIGHDGNMDLSITIRTMIHSEGRLRFWAGGGIVADSEVASEYAECHDKASAMLRLCRHFQPDEVKIRALGR